MTKSPIFKATFADIANVKTRDVVKFVFEVPNADADGALAILGGMPRNGTSVWVGIARLDPEKAASAPAIEPSAPVKERRKFNTLPLPQQVAITCGEGAFARFLVEEKGCADDPRSPEQFVRDYCGVKSRAEIVSGTDASERWGYLHRSYLAWLQVDA